MKFKIIAFSLLVLFPVLSMAVSFSFQYADLRNVLYELSKTYNVTVIFSEEVDGTVNASFTAQNIDEALKISLLNTGYTFAKINGIYVVGGVDSPDTTKSVLYKPTVTILRNTNPQTVYDLLGTMSKYVVYAPNSAILVVNADDENRRRIDDIISKVDVPNANRFFSYEVHEMTTDEYGRFRQFIPYSNSGIITFSNVAFNIFKEIIKISGESDHFGTVALSTIGEMKIESTDLPLSVNVSSKPNEVSAVVQTGGNAAIVTMTPEKSHAVLNTKIDGKEFLILMGFADTPAKSDLPFTFEKEKEANYLTADIQDTIGSGEFTGNFTYGSTQISMLAQIEFSSTSGISAIAIGLKGNMIADMFGSALLKLSNGIPSVIGILEDTTSIGIFRMKASFTDELTMYGFEPPILTAAAGIELFNFEVFGGVRGAMDSLNFYIEADLTYESVYATVFWDQEEGYTFGGGMRLRW